MVGLNHQLTRGGVGGTQLPVEQRWGGGTVGNTLTTPTNLLVGETPPPLPLNNLLFITLSLFIALSLIIALSICFDLLTTPYFSVAL